MNSDLLLARGNILAIPPSSSSLIVLDGVMDSQRRRYWGETNEAQPALAALQQPIIIDLNEAGPIPYPYYRDPVNWSRWLKGHHIEQVICYQPQARAWALLMAANGRVPIIIYLTGQIEEGAIRRLKFMQGGIDKFYCAGRFLANQLQHGGINQKRIAVQRPAVWVDLPGADERRNLRERVRKRFAGPLLLAWAEFGNIGALKPLVWAGAILRHLLPNLTMIVTDPHGFRTNRRQMRHWQEIMDAPGLIYLEQDEISWDSWVDVCDAVIVGPGPLYEVWRLLHVLAQRRPIITCHGPADEFLAGYEGAFYSNTNQPREIARVIIKALEKLKGPI